MVVYVLSDSSIYEIGVSENDTPVSQLDVNRSLRTHIMYHYKPTASKWYK